MFPCLNLPGNDNYKRPIDESDVEDLHITDVGLKMVRFKIKLACVKIQIRL